MYGTSEEYKAKVYEPSAKKTLDIYIDDTEVASKNKLGYSSTQNFFDNNEFALGATPAQSIELRLPKNVSYNINSKIKTETRLLLSHTPRLYETIPIGTFNIDRINEEDVNTTTLTLIDDMIKFEFIYNASELINKKGYATLGEIVEDICNKAGVECGSKTFLGSEKKVSVYDDQLTARVHLRYIAEQAGGIAVIGRDGKLYIRTIGENVIEYPQKYFKTVAWGDRFKVSRVSFNNGIQVFEKGTQDENTIYIDPNNIYIVDQEQIDNIYNLYEDLEVYSFSGSGIIDPAIDVGDLLLIGNKYVIFQGTKNYTGRWIADISSEIRSKTQEETTVKTVSEAVERKRIKSEINQIEGHILQLMEDTSENSETLTRHNQTFTSITNTVSRVETRVETVENDAIVSSVEEFYLSTSPTSLSGGSWSATQPEWTEGKYIWRRTLVTKGDGTASYQPSQNGVCITGNTGAQGEQGIQGVQGDKGDKGDTGAKGDKGDTGEAGTSGVGISTVTEYYAVSSSNSTAPTSWQTTVPTMTSTNKYLWNYEKTTYTDNSTSETAKRVIGVYGDTGAKGDTGATGSTGATGNGISSITNYYLATTSSSGVTISTSGWTTSVQSVSSSKKYLWNYEVVKYTDNTTSTTTPCIVGVYGDTGATGKGISSITEKYAVSSSNSTSPTSWSNSVPTMTTTNKYLWNYEIITYTDSTTSETTKKVIGVYGNTGSTGAKGETGATGATGNGISSITNYYLTTSASSGVTTSTSGWSTTPTATTTTNKYLWNYEVIKYTDNTSTTTTPHIIGTHGATGEQGIGALDGIPDSPPYARWTFDNIIDDSYYPENNNKYHFNKMLGTLKSQNGKAVFDGSQVARTICDLDWDSSFSISFWISTTITNANQTILQNRTEVGKGLSIFAINNKLRFDICDGQYTFNNFSLVLNELYFVTFIVDKTNLKIKMYINGNLSESKTLNDSSTPSLSLNNYLWIGMSSTTGTNFNSNNLKSSIDDLRIYDYAITDENIDYLYRTNGQEATNGIQGAKGDKGDAGEAGRGISSTAVTYQASASGTTVPTGTWSTSVPDTSADKPYLWTKTVITYTDNTTSTSYSVGSTLKGVSVGSRNYLLNSDIEKSVTRNGGNVFIDYDFSDILKTLTNTTFTFSVDAYGSSNGIYCDFYFRNASGNLMHNYTNCTITTEYNRYSMTVELTEDISNLQILRFRVTADGTVTIKNAKLETGNITTDWTPAPEDIENTLSTNYYTKTETNTQISESANSITLSVNETISTAKQEAIDSANGTTDEKLLNYSTTSQMNSAISTTAQSINLEVAKKVGNDEIISKINQSAETVKINANKIELSANDVLDILAGNEINLGTKQITIASDNLKIDEYGHVYCSTINLKDNYFAVGEYLTVYHRGTYINNLLTLDSEGMIITDTSLTTELRFDENSISYWNYAGTIDGWQELSRITFEGTNTSPLLNIIGDITATGIFTSTYSDVAFRHIHPTTNIGIYFGVGSGGYNRGIYDPVNSMWQVYTDQTGNTYLQANGHNIYLRPNNSSTGQTYINTNGFIYMNGFKLPEVRRGTVSITPSAANTPTGKAVTFSQTFSGTPTVVCSAHSTVPGTTVTGVGATSPSSTNVTIYVTRTNTTTTEVYYIATYY